MFILNSNLSKNVKIKSDLALKNLYGNVKEVETKVYNRDSEVHKSVQGKLLKEICIDTYDENGKLLAWSMNCLDEKSFYHGTLAYNQRGELREECEYEDEILQSKTLNLYDEEGRKTVSESLTYKSDGIAIFSKRKTYYVYKDNSIDQQNRALKNLESIVFLNSAGQIVWDKSYEKQRIGDGKEVTTERSYLYDRNDQLVEVTIKELSANSSIYIEKQLFNYSSCGRKIEGKLVSLPSREVCSIQRIAYDEKGNELALEVKSDYEDYKIIQVFDDKYNIIERNLGNSTMNWEYEYDKMGNWIKKSLQLAGAKILMEERSIT